MRPIEEAFPTFPIASLPDIPSDWRDESRCSDPCPIFRVGDLFVIIEFPEPSNREDRKVKRFSVVHMPDDDDDGTDLCESDDWSDVLAVVEAHKVAA